MARHVFLSRTDSSFVPRNMQQHVGMRLVEPHHNEQVNARSHPHKLALAGMQNSQNRSTSIKQVEEENLLTAGEPSSSSFVPLETELSSQQKAAFKCACWPVYD